MSVLEDRIYIPKVYSDSELIGKCGIYQIRNLQNGKIYIGSSCRLYDRKLQHKNENHAKNTNKFMRYIDWIEQEDKLQ